MAKGTVTSSNVRDGRTVWVLYAKPDGQRALIKYLIGRDITREHLRTILAQFKRAPAWYSRRKALSHLRLYSPMA